MDKIWKTAKEHYEKLIDENNDPVRDPEPLKGYMDHWDGQEFIESLCLTREKTVLEVGVGTGRLAIRTAPQCKDFYGIDFSPKTIERARENLREHSNVTLICGDFTTSVFQQQFDVIYSSLTFMHIENKAAALEKMTGLLKPGGRLVLSIDKNEDEFIEMHDRKVKLYPDYPEETLAYIQAAGLLLEKQRETDFAHHFICKKPAS